METVEIEARAALNEDEYHKLMRTLSSPSLRPFRQENTYFDTEDGDLLKRRMMLRLREREGRAEITLKIPLPAGSREITEGIDDGARRLLIDGGVLPAGEIEGALGKALPRRSLSLKVVGRLATLRLDLPYGGSLISIDEDRYGNEVDHVVEAEARSENEAEADLLAFLREHSIPYRPQESAKSLKARSV